MKIYIVTVLLNHNQNWACTIYNFKIIFETANGDIKRLFDRLDEKESS